MKLKSKLLGQLSLLVMSGVLSLSAAADTNQQLQSLAQESNALQARYPVGSIVSEEQADQALQTAQQIQQALQLWAQQAEAECYERFFAYACLQELRQTRRQHADKVQAIILEAKSTQRRLRLQERDEELQQRNNKAAKN